MCLSVLFPQRYPHAIAPSTCFRNYSELLRDASIRLPRLRYFALAWDKASVLDGTGKEDYAGDAAPWVWWKIARDSRGTPEQITEIPAWEGERVREHMRAADEATMQAFEGT